MNRIDVENKVLEAIREAVKNSGPIVPVPNVKKGKRERIRNFQQNLKKLLEEKQFIDCDNEKYIFKDGLSDPTYKGIQDRADVYAKKDSYEIIID